MAQFLNNLKCTVSTIPQSDPAFLEERHGLITGSKRSTISYLLAMKEKFEKFIREGDPKMKKQNKDKLNEILLKINEAAKKFCGLIPDDVDPEHMEAVQYGLDNEDRLRDELSVKLEQTIYQVGLCRSIQISFMGASPDGVLENGDIVELKTTSKAIPTSSKSDYSEIQIGHMEQMQQTMGVTGALNCHYYISSKLTGETYYRCVPFNQQIWNKIVRSNTHFYNTYMRPLLMRRISEEDRKRIHSEICNAPIPESLVFSFAQIVKNKK